MIQPKAEPNDWDEDTFLKFALLAKDECGISISTEKSLMMKSRIAPLVKAKKLPTFRSYFDFLKSNSCNIEKQRVISAITTNVSYFFREPHHFEIMLHYMNEAKQNPFRVWCAGSSNGQECYSIVMKAHELRGGPERLKVLATDIDLEVLQFAKQGIYSQSMTKGVPTQILESYFNKIDRNGEMVFEIKNEIKDTISFKQLNLLNRWPMEKKFDVIFCRNVVIYFDDVIRRSLWPRFSQILKPGALMFVGHSERISSPESFGFELVGPTAYRRTTDATYDQKNGQILEARHGFA